MKLKDLKQGMVGKLRNKESITVLNSRYFFTEHIMYNMKEKYNEDLTHKENKRLDIMEITYGDKIVFERKESRWFVPEDGEYYYSINEYGNIEPHKNVKDSFDNETVFKNVRVFKTEEEAEKRLRQQQATLSVEHWIAENDDEFDLNNVGVWKWIIAYNIKTKELLIDYYGIHIVTPKQFVLSSEKKARQLIKEREKELKIMFGVEE